MTEREILKRILRIDPLDDESAHGMEDEIHLDVLKYITENCTDEDCKRLAGAALKTTDLKFSRWCS